MEFYILAVFIILICLQTFLHVCSAQSFKKCKFGKCAGFKSCLILKQAVNIQSKSQEISKIIERNRCGSGQSVNLCCGDIEVEILKRNIIPNINQNGLNHLLHQTCGSMDVKLPSLTARVDQGLNIQSDKTFSEISPFENSHILLNGINAQAYEFPWMALLEYNTPTGRNFLCGGSLISSRYVLTAAHCFLSKNAELTNVRLGVHDKTNDCISTEGAGVTACGEPLQIHEIEDIIIHNGFNYATLANDIALVRLKEKALFGESVYPICVTPQKGSIKNLSNATIAGWGLTVSGKTSDILQKADLPVLSNDFCSQLFGRHFSSAFICAGGNKGIDTCKGDSGGPLFRKGLDGTSPKYVQYGILSSGGTVCGGENTVPSIYTNVQSHLPWISRNVRD